MFKETRKAILPSIAKRLTTTVFGAMLLVSPYWVAAQTAEKSAPMSKQHESMSAKGDAKSMDSMAMHKSMMKGMKDMEAMKPSGDPDHDFAMMMKMHHQMALDMAEVELKQGKDAAMRNMAKKIIDAQKKEIKEFDQWLAKHKKPMADHKGK